MPGVFSKEAVPKAAVEAVDPYSKPVRVFSKEAGVFMKLASKQWDQSNAKAIKQRGKERKPAPRIQVASDVPKRSRDILSSTLLHELQRHEVQREQNEREWPIRRTAMPINLGIEEFNEGLAPTWRRRIDPPGYVPPCPRLRDEDRLRDEEEEKEEDEEEEEEEEAEICCRSSSR